MENIDPIIEFLKGKEVEFKSFPLETDKTKTRFHMKYFWDIIKPEGNILNMGIMKKTPGSIVDIIDNKNVKSILHFELDVPHKIKISSKEKVLWKTDFCKYVSNCKSSSFDGVVIWHGPEHMPKKDGYKAIQEGIRVAKKWILVSCPWNRLKGWKQEPKGKEHLGHKSTWDENDYLNFGLRTFSIGEKGIYPGYLFGWKIKE